MSLVAKILLEADDGVPSPPPEQLAWIQRDWVPRVSSLLARLAPSRPAEGSPEEASAIGELMFVLVEPLTRVSSPWWMTHLRGSFRHLMEDSVRREFQNIEADRKLALRFLQKATDNVVGVFDQVFRRLREAPAGPAIAAAMKSAMSVPSDAEMNSTVA